MYELELKTAAAAARQAGKLLTAMAIRGVTVDYKGAIDLVTEADRASEALVVKALRAAFPADDIMTEESEAERTGSDRRWIIDPLDGTTNYAHRFPCWCVSIAFEHRGQVQAGAVCNPNLKELFTARRGHGAFLNGARLKVSRQPELSRCLLATGFPYDVHTSERDNLEHFRRFIKRAQAVRRPGSAAIDLAYVACGRFDGFWEIKLKPWDMAAASLLVTEAGGTVSRFDGSPFDLYVQECLASNGLVHRAMIDVLK
ncbi:MAG: inositol monophosphatase [Candidatus Edwardsbacteria bacterium]|jgi:myo-inositol-1(or 4)-monophosphatase|nr:inositol monophosphatase [Candidatus Edwardsbacteria bacterium]